MDFLGRWNEYGVPAEPVKLGFRREDLCLSSWRCTENKNSRVKHSIGMTIDKGVILRGNENVYLFRRKFFSVFFLSLKIYCFGFRVLRFGLFFRVSAQQGLLASS